MSATKLRIGVLGRRGLSVAAGIAASPDAELTAFCELNPEVLYNEANLYGIDKRFSSLDEMLDCVDAVVVATPMHLHAEHVIRALRAGRHVLCEVTACVSLDECRQIVQAVESSSKTYMMAENYCYIRDNVLVREMAGRGMFGSLYHGEGEYLHDCKPYHHNRDGSPTWRYHWQVGQNGNTYPTHSVGPVLQWFGSMDASDRPKSVTCLGSGVHTDPEHPHEDTTITLVKMASGKLISLRLDMMSNRPHQMAYYALQGTQGVYEASRISGQPGSVWIGENSGPGYVQDVERSWRPLGDFDDLLPERWRNPPPEALNAGHGGGDYFIVRDFIDSVLGQIENPVDVYTAMDWTAIGFCSQKSIGMGGVPVALPNFRPNVKQPNE